MTSARIDQAPVVDPRNGETAEAAQSGDCSPVPLEAIVRTDELWRRPRRAPDHERENRALARLMQALGETPQSILQTLADTVLEVLNADSAGLSLLTDDGRAFYWAAIAGDWKPHLGGGTPRDFGPCGDVLDCNAPMLFSRWERRYAYLAEAVPLAEEGLLVPFHVGGKAVGTIWVIAHSGDRSFDAEDLRQLESMGRFASAAYRTVKLLDAQEASRAAMESLERVRESEHRFYQLLQALPAAIYTTDAEGKIDFYNEAAVEFAGRRPALGDHWCVTWRLLNPDGSPLPHDACPMAIALKEGRPVRGAEAIAERPDGTQRWFAPYPTPLRDPSGKLTGAINMLVDITERKEAERLQKLLLDELNHRVKNTLASVQSVVVQAAKSARDVDEFRHAVEGRILALSRAHNQLSRRSWADVELHELLRACIAPYLSKANVALDGGPTIVAPRIGLMLCMAIHELATNAAKYGALSTPVGRVSLRWDIEEAGDQRLLRLHWLERDGPPVTPPERKGFGTRLLERGIQMELRGTTSIRFSPSGVECDITIPLTAHVRSSIRRPD
jgi:PAS domain S-box-containing protein